MNPTEQELQVLKQHFGYNQFRSGQWKIIDQVIHHRKDILGILATGQGKSLCYQYPALLNQRCSVVISPLISLMEDQKLGLESKGIPAEVLSGGTTDYLATMEKVVRGDFRVVFTTPEYIAEKYGFLKLMAQNGVLELIGIDEAHCISQWGHDFRPSYRKLRGFRELVPDVPIVALSATATPTIAQDIVDSLGCKDPVMIRTTAKRPNLSIWCQPKGYQSELLGDFRAILGSPEEMGKKNQDDKYDSVIIYCNSRKDCEHVQEVLSDAGYLIDYYHAGMSDARRSEVHQRFIFDQVPMVSATIAFGMGIDKPNIRKIINWGIPANLETYYQEIGRAGRDGLESSCYLLYSSQDLMLQKFLISKSESKEVAEHQLHLLNRMWQFTNSLVCRQYLLSSYFDREQLANECGDLDEQCGKCDNCYSRKKLGSPMEEEKVEIGKEASLFLRLVRGLYTNYGFRNLVAILTGSNSKTISDGFKRTPFFGKGKDHTQVYWRALGDLLIDLGYLKYTQVGGLYSRKSNDGKVFQVVTIGPKKLDLDDNGELWVIPNLNLKKCLRSPGHQLESGEKVSRMENDLYHDLLKFRKEVSRQSGRPPHLVLSDPVINLLLELERPTDVNRVAMVDGINFQVMMEFGEKLVEVINQNQEMVVKIDPDDPKILVGELEVLGIEGLDKLTLTQKITLGWLQRGLTLDQIGEKRKMTKSTIETHIQKIVQYCPELDYEEFLEEEDFCEIVEYLPEQDLAKVRLRELRDQVKAGVGKDYNYLQLKIAIGIKSRV